MDSKFNHSMRYGPSKKKTMVSSHGECRRMSHCSSEEESNNFSNGAALSKPSVLLEGLHRILIRDLVVGHRHRGQVLYGRLCVQPLRILAVHTILEDDKGDAVRLCVYNAIQNVISEQHLEFVFSKDVKVAIKEPYFAIDEEGTLAIKVDNPSDIVRSPAETEADLLGLIPSSPACGLLLSDALNFRKQGNKAFGSEDWDQAVRLYTEAAKVLLPLGYKSLLHPSYLRDEIREELLIVFSNRAEARLLLRHYEAAEIDARVALQLQSDHRKSLSRRGRALYGLHRYKEANLCFRKALTISAGDGKLETEKGFLRKLIEESSICEQQRTTGMYNVVELVRDAKSGRNPVCGEYVGPVIIGAAKDANMGRAILVNRDVEPGELLIVSKAIAHAEINLDLPRPLDKRESVGEWERMWKTLHDLIVPQVLGRARSSELFQKQVCGLMLSTHGTEDVSIPSMDLYSSADKETDMCTTAVEGEEIFNVLDEDVHLELDADQISQAVERSSFLSLESWGGLWFLPSFINHSCLPNACWMKIGEDALFVRAARHLRKGDEVTVSYLGGETVAFPHRAYAARLRGFKCSCPRCLFEASEKFIENLGVREWVNMTTMCNISNAVKFYQLLESSVKLIEKLEWGFKNVASLWNAESKQEWVRCSFAQAYKTCLAFCAFHGQAFAQDLEILIRAVHATIGASEEFLDFLSPFMWVHPQLEAAIAPMCLCLYGEQSSASLREILGVEMEN